MTNILTETEKYLVDEFCETYRFNDGFREFIEAQFAFCVSNVVDENRLKQLDITLAYNDFLADLV